MVSILRVYMPSLHRHHLSGMEFFRGLNEDSSSELLFAQQDIQRCPFLRNINEPTNFSFSSSLGFPVPVRGAKGPIFEDGSNFDLAFRLFHGRHGVVPLTGRSFQKPDTLVPESAPKFNPLAAKAATISFSAFGPGGAFSFDFFSEKWKKQNQRSSSKKEGSQQGSSHEAMSNEWLETGNCPIAKSYRAVSHVPPLVAKALQPPPGMKLKCPTAVVAAREALARTALVKNLRPQPLPAKMLVIGMLGMAANVPLGVWREHTKKFSPAWFAAIHAAIPFIAMLRKSVLMPKSAMAFTIAASILGQVIGSRAEMHRLKKIAARASVESTVMPTEVFKVANGGDAVTAPLTAGIDESSSHPEHRSGTGTCGMYVWNQLPLKATPESSSGEVCF